MQQDEPFVGYNKMPEELKERVRRVDSKCAGCGRVYFGQPRWQGVVARPVREGRLGRAVGAQRKLRLEVVYCSTECMRRDTGRTAREASVGGRPQGGNGDTYFGTMLGYVKNLGGW